MYKEIICPVCNGRGYISGGDDYSTWSKTCDNCNGHQFVVVPMTNGDIIRACNNEQLAKLHHNLKVWALYSGGNNNHLLNDSQEDFLLWLNKDADEIDLKTVFDFMDEDDYEHPYISISKHLKT